MYDIDQCILVTNNDRAAGKWRNVMQKVLLVDSFSDVLTKTRDLIYAHCILLTHPQTSSLKPNQTPYKSILLYPAARITDKERNFRDIELIEDAAENFSKWNAVRKTPVYSENIADDYKTIDLSMIENVISRL